METEKFSNREIGGPQSTEILKTSSYMNTTHVNKATDNSMPMSYWRRLQYTMDDRVRTGFQSISFFIPFTSVKK